MSLQASPADTVIEARWVIPVEPAHALLADHSVVIVGDRIAAILPTAEARIRYTPRSRVELPAHAVIPGLINLHTHAAMTLMRGLADDLALMDWLNHHIWPAELKHVSEPYVYDGTRLACAEMLRGGVTCFNDMYFFPQAAARMPASRAARAVACGKKYMSLKQVTPPRSISAQARRVPSYTYGSDTCLNSAGQIW